MASLFYSILSYTPRNLGPVSLLRSLYPTGHLASIVILTGPTNVSITFAKLSFLPVLLHYLSGQFGDLSQCNIRVRQWSPSLKAHPITCSTLCREGTSGNREE
jgi:hypothetical protein